MTTEVELQDEEYEDFDASYEADEDLYQPYKSVSKAAVSALVLAIFSLTGLLFPALLAAAFLAILAGIVGLRNLRRYPDELTGKTAAILGIVGGVVLLIGGSAMHTYIYVTEVPDGYQRISFEDLQLRDDGGAPRGAPNLPTELDGKRVFIKGYIHPGVAEMGELRNFILVPDMGTCCFGGQPALSDMVEVNITGEHGLYYSQIKRKLAGTFHVFYRLKKVAGGLQGGYYELKADYAR